MNTYFKVRSISAIIFIIFLFGFSAINIYYFGKDIISEIQTSIDKKLTPKEFVTSVDAKINEKLLYKKAFIEGYGYMQKLMDKNEFSNFSIVKDKQENMHYTYFATGANSTKELSDRTAKFAKEMEKQGTNFVYLMTPDKYLKGFTEFPKGMAYAYHNETADNFINELNENNVDYIDFRDSILNSGIDKDKLFFKTDHHWTIESSFWAFTELINQLNERYKLNLDPDNFYRDINNYNSIIYKESYLGSMGRKTGMLYGGVDDFNLIYPKFNTSYRYYTDSKSQKFDLSGRFEESLILSYPFNANMDLLDAESDKYFTYLLGNRPFVQVTNNNNPDGLKVLFVKDSLIVPTSAFFSSMCSQMDLIDPRYYEGDIVEYAKSQDYDFVFLSVYPQNLVDQFFPFFKETNLSQS